MEELEDVHQDYKGRGLKVVSVLGEGAIAGPPKQTHAIIWADELELTFTVLPDVKQVFWPIWNPDGVLPIVYIIAEDGVIAWMEAGGVSGIEEIRKQLDDMVGDDSGSGGDAADDGSSEGSDSDTADTSSDDGSDTDSETDTTGGDVCADDADATTSTVWLCIEEMD